MRKREKWGHRAQIINREEGGAERQKKKNFLFFFFSFFFARTLPAAVAATAANVDTGGGGGRVINENVRERRALRRPFSFFCRPLSLSLSPSPSPSLSPTPFSSPVPPRLLRGKKGHLQVAQRRAHRGGADGLAVRQQRRQRRPGRAEGRHGGPRPVAVVGSRGGPAGPEAREEDDLFFFQVWGGGSRETRNSFRERKQKWVFLFVSFFLFFFEVEKKKLKGKKLTVLNPEKSASASASL